MTIERLRPLPDLAEVYKEPHDHRAYGHDHAVRVALTQGLGVWLANWKGCRSGADLSCGNGKIADHIAVHAGTRFVLGDYAHDDRYDYHGLMELTLVELGADIVSVDLFVCCETIEHLEDPGYVLKTIRRQASCLLLSTPIDNFGDTNPEHLWAWDRDGVTELFTRAGFTELAFAASIVQPDIGGAYTYGIWALS